MNQNAKSSPSDSGAGLGQSLGSAFFVRLFKPQFALLVELGQKCQTVRPVPKRTPKPGDRISLRCWTDKPYRSKQRVLRESVISGVKKFRLRQLSGKMCMSIDDWPLSEWDAEGFARADGFTSLPEMAEWFQNTHGLPFEGIVIYWQNATDERRLPEERL